MKCLKFLGHQYVMQSDGSSYFLFPHHLSLGPYVVPDVALSLGPYVVPNVAHAWVYVFIAQVCRDAILASIQAAFTFLWLVSI